MRITQTMKNAIREQYAVGSFSPRYLICYAPVLRAGQDMRSPLIVQASMSEINRFISTPEAVAREYFTQRDRLGVSVPCTLHLDHCKDFDFIRRCIAAGFESVMIDASDQPLEKNIEITKRVVEYAHARDVEVEAELGRIASTDNIETAKSDAELYTVPEEAGRFVRETGVDLLAISVGTAHGAYRTAKPRVDVGRIREIRALVPIPLVLHGASGVPDYMVHSAYEMDCGGVSKINIATDLEQALLQALHCDHSLTNESVMAYPPESLDGAREAVYEVVCDKIRNFLKSQNRAW